MKTKITSNNFGPMLAQTRTDFVHLRNKPQQSTHMKKLIAAIMLVCLWAATPLLQAQTIETYTFTTNRLVPDGNAAGLGDVRTISSAIGNITSLKVGFKLTGEFNGDLYVYLRHSSGYTVLLNRPGKTAGNSAGYADSGFNVTFQDGAANGDVHLYQSVITPADGSPLTGTWQPDGRTNDPANVTDAAARATALSSFNGLNAAGEWTLFVSDVESGGTNMLTEWSLQISGGAYPTLTWANPADITYGTALGGTQLNATATYNSTNVPGTFAYSPATGAVLNAGSNQTLTAIFTPTDASSFLPVTNHVAINVLNASLIVTANSTNRLYGAANPAFTGSVTDQQNGDNITATFVTTADTSSPVGGYAITPVLSDPGNKLGNYTVTTNTGILSVGQASITVAAGNQSRIYGAANPTLTASYSGFVNGETASVISGSPALGTSAGTNSVVGNYAITVGTGSLSAANYSFTFTNGTLTVGKATVIVAADDQSRVYGATNLTLTASYSGFVNNENAGVLSGSPALTTSADTNSPVGSYAIEVSLGSLSATNYDFAFTNGTLTVGKALIIVAANNTNRVYGAANPTFTASYSGFVDGESQSVLDGSPSLTTSADTNSVVGNYTITASVGSLSSTNYAFAFTNGTLTVTAADLIVTADSTNRLYGAANPAFTGSVTGQQNGDNITATFVTTADINSAVGGYAITPVLSDPGSKLGNYTVTTNTGTLSVGQVAITVTAQDKSKAYGAALPAFTATYSGFALNQGTNDLTGLATLTTTATPTSNAGTYAITASGATSANYSFTYFDGTLTITNSLTSGDLVSSANPALPGADVTFTMTVSAVAPGVGTPNGTVNFRVDGSVLGTGTLSGGVATFATNNLAHGSHTVVAEYAGNANFGGSTNTLSPVQVINTPPVAGGDTIERYPAQGVKVRLAELLGKASDADSDTLTITVSPASASNNTVTVSGAWVFFTPASGFTNADSFTYTVTDGHGGSATGTVTVAIKVDNAPSQNLVIVNLDNGSFRIDGNGIPGRTYRLQSATTLSPANWQDISGGSVTADTVGKFEYTDTPGEGSRFYRTVYP